LQYNGSNYAPQSGGIKMDEVGLNPLLGMLASS